MIILKIILLDTVLEILYFPLWWYTKGLFKVGRGIINSIIEYDNTVGFSIWVRNLFVPMFGQTDWQGRIVSFFMRLVNIIFRGIAFLFAVALHLAVFLVWIAGPLFILFFISQYFIKPKI